MKKTRGQPVEKNGNEYQRGYLEGMKAAFEDTELDAYYAGVGYGKRIAGDKNLGFNSAKECETFEQGIRNKDKHFKSYRAKEPNFFERLFGLHFGKDRINYASKSDRKRMKRYRRRNEYNQAKQKRRARSKVRRSGWGKY